MNRDSIRRLAYWIVCILVSAIFLYYALRGVDWRGVRNIITHADLRFIGAAAALTSGSFFLRAVRWRILLNAEGRFGVGTVFCANMAGYLGNTYLPARAGEVIRSVLISRHSRLSKTFVLTTALSERLMDVIAVVLWSSIVLLGVNPKPTWMQDLSRGLVVVAGAGALFVVVLPHAGGLLESILKRLPMPAAIRTGLLGLMEQVLLGMRAFHHWGRLAGFTALTIVVWGTDAVTAITGARALGVHISFSVAMLLLTAMALGSALPSTPGYVGVYQFAAVEILTPFGISRDAALACSLVGQAMTYVLVLVWGLPGLYFLRRKVPAA